ncbi:hypothetical protein CGZ93_17835 [Enemella dayhoffiae]|uniref:Uncharacterized protein n=1 Tax=Enemella dayhoffiae TaxID=2016507 RepID=A0A255GM29_9ACTN|nr:hypothetical protein [Enemella dayhoffiae]OYO16621.1 hypothetical protein CGZ93_17835 [Enemella dayhoffiae]
MDRQHHHLLTHARPRPMPWHARPNTCLNCGWTTWYAPPLITGWNPAQPGPRIQVDPTPISEATADQLDRPTYWLTQAITDPTRYVLRPRHQPPLTGLTDRGDLLPEHRCHQPEVTPTIPSRLPEETP